MKGQFDNKLAAKIKATFAAHQEPADAAEWDKFLTKLEAKKRKGTAILWAKWLSAAAVLIIGIIWFLPNDQTMEESSMPITELNIPVESEESAEALVEKPIREESIKSNTEKTDRPQLLAENSGKEPVQKSREILTTKAFASSSQAIYDLTEETLIEPAITTSEDISILDPLTSRKETETINPKPISPIMNQEQALSVIQEWLAENISEAEMEEKEAKAMTKEPVKLGVMVAPQTISNSNVGLNLGAGFMSEFSFSKRLKLDVGMAYASQNINPNAPNGSPLLMNRQDQLNTDMQSANFAGNFISATDQLLFGQLEVPVNLKYKMFDRKSSDIFLVSGFSNMIYLNQRNISTVNIVEIPASNLSTTGAEIRSISETMRPSPDQSASDLGTMLNFGLGYEQNLNNGTSIYIEPFYKFSLGNQTFTEQQFSIGGINLRMNFQIKNKKTNGQ